MSVPAGAVPYNTEIVDAEKEAMQLDRDDRGTCLPRSILDATNGSDFMRSVTRAKTEATHAVEVLDDMMLWVKRLAPYFDLDPKMTVAQALQLYEKDRPRKHEASGDRF